VSKNTYLQEVSVYQQLFLRENINLPNGSKVKVILKLEDSASSDLLIHNTKTTVVNKTIEYLFTIENLALQKKIPLQKIVKLIIGVDINHDDIIKPTEETNYKVTNNFYKIGIHSNSRAGDEADYTEGHSWLSLQNMKTNEFHTYGLWTDKQRASGASGSDKGVLTDEEIRRKYQAKYSEYKSISEIKYKKFVQYKDEKDAWMPTHTCADWARDGYKVATGIDLDVDDWLGLETPRELSETIKKRMK
jgi:hypothetical protein